MPKATGTDRLFVDEANIYVRGGKGGDGCVSFRREKFIPKGGPDGGDGGSGGSVFLLARQGIDTLLDLAGRHHYRAENGRPGEGKNRHGRNGKDLVVEVPTGTLVYDHESGRLLKDLTTDGERIRVAPGGRGGYGNLHYVSATNQTPRNATPGLPGRERTLRLQLKLIADVGLAGLPNAGKSTLLSRITRARPKIAAYPFTTLEPQLGIVELPGFRRLVVADIPGLIEGAHEGVGLGDAFLKHVERTRVIVHLVDLCPLEGQPAPAEAYRIIRRELEKYSPALAKREELVVATKLDLTEAHEALQTLQKELARPVVGISAVTGQNLRELTEAMWQAVERARVEPAAEATPLRFEGLADDPVEDDAAPDRHDTDADSPSDLPRTFPGGRVRQAEDPDISTPTAGQQSDPTETNGA